MEEDRSGLKHLVLGSVAERVLREAHCPVLVVHDGERSEAAAIASEVAQYRSARVVVPARDRAGDPGDGLERRPESPAIVRLFAAARRGGVRRFDDVTRMRV